MIPSLPPPESPSAAEAARHELVAYIEEACQAVEVEIHSLGADLSQWNRTADSVNASDSPVQFEWDGDACSARPNLTLSILQNELVTTRVSVRPHLTVWVNAPVAAIDLKPQQPISIEWRKVPIQKLSRQPVATSGVARVGIRAGEPLTRLIVTSAPDLRNGSHVSIVVRRGELTVYADGTALSDGLVGETIPVLSGATKTALHGTLIDAQTVELR